MSQCVACGSQDRKYMTGISKKPGRNFGKPWAGWKCQEKACGNMEFVKSAPSTSKPQATVPSGDFAGIHRKLDMILNALGVKTSIEGANQEMQILGEEGTPF